MKKKYKKLLIGFILLWVVGFAVVWGVTLLKKGSAKKEKAPEMLEMAEQGQQPPAQKKEAVPVRCYRTALMYFKDDLPVMGTVRGAQEITCKFEINGVVDAINYREGDIIYKDDLIATLNKKDVQLKIDYAKSKLESARIQHLAAQKKLDIHKSLYEIGGIIKAKLEEVELEVKSAELQVESAEVELKSAESEFEKTNLHAPRDGVLGSKDVEVGEFVTSNDKIATLYNTMQVFVELGIVEKDIEKLALEQDTAVTVDAYRGVDFKGIIDNIVPIIEGKSRTLTVRVVIENEDAMLLPGMFARALITIAEFEDAIVVPSMSINKTEDEGYNAFIVNEDAGTVEMRPVEVAYVTTDYTVIASGIAEGELVVSDTPQELKDGMDVDVIEVQEPEVQEPGVEE
ncbi:MAG: efflux RND transporter periplasmic adaptor subunit [Candidatus Gorgyraea atricola]|nr:efflux RND transporter periplasmic adaptor subunit [Candidatus Gorgyraea atricola]